jgi:hypothetical protein
MAAIERSRKFGSVEFNVIAHVRRTVADRKQRHDDFVLDESSTPVNKLTLSLPFDECSVCIEHGLVRSLSCCSLLICRRCIYAHVSVHIAEARIRILCPSCPHVFTREEIIELLTDNEPEGNIIERYKRFYADINREPHRRTCPQCSCLKQFDEKLFESARQRRQNTPRRVVCDECHFVWCFYCHAPWHEHLTCKEYQGGEKLLRVWAAQKSHDQHNAKQCPRCKVRHPIGACLSHDTTNVRPCRCSSLGTVVVLTWSVRNVTVTFATIAANDDWE